MTARRAWPPPNRSSRVAKVSGVAFTMATSAIPTRIPPWLRDAGAFLSGVTSQRKEASAHARSDRGDCASAGTSARSACQSSTMVVSAPSELSGYRASATAGPVVTSSAVSPRSAAEMPNASTNSPP